MYSQKNVEHGIMVRMLGGFTVTYDGREVALGRNSSARFVQLLQMVWLQGRRGITKEKLVENLYDRDEISNMNSSFNTLVYRLRRQMQSAGLPEGDYIVRKNGVYVADESVPVWVDALEFEEQMTRADSTGSQTERAACYRAAFDLYQGDLLPGGANQFWIYEKVVKYKRLFEKCVSALGEYARENRDFAAMEAVYNKAVQLYPLEDWESDLLDAMLANGKFRQAQQFYNKTVRLYAEKLNFSPPERMVEIYKRMNGKKRHHSSTLEAVQELLKEPSDDPAGFGAYYCSFSGFTDIYRLLSRNMDRSGISMYLMLCTLVDYEGKEIYNEEKQKERSEALCTAIRASLRQGDVFARYSASQYLILVTNVRDEDCAAIFRRISLKLRIMTSNQADIVYQVKAISRDR